MNYETVFQLAKPHLKKNDFEKTIETVSFQPLHIPLYSSAKGGRVVEPTTHYLWEVVRETINFKELIAHMLNQEDCVFVDVSPTGTLANFIKYGFEGKVPSFFAMNPFGQNLKTLNALVTDLQQV